MIPSSFLGLVLFAASLGPGYVYLQVAERKAPRVARSALAEAVEMLAIGSLASLGAALVVLLAGDWVGALDAHQLSTRGGKYFVDHPARGLGSLMVAFGLAYFVAWSAAQLVHVRQEAVNTPSGNAWQQAFRLNRPTKNHATVVTVELRDGRKVVGVLDRFTTELRDSRELHMVAPIGVQASGKHPIEPTEDAFLVLREADVLYVSGRYWSAGTCPQVRPETGPTLPISSAPDGN